MDRAEQLRLFAQHEQAALKIARGFRVPVERAELEAAARRGLWDAIVRGDATQASFAWYASCRVRGEIRDELRRHDWVPRRERQREDACTVVYFDQLRPDVAESAASVTQNYEDALDEKREVALFHRALARVHGRDREIVLLVLGGERMRDIAARFGITEARVSQLLSRTRIRLTAALKRMRAKPSVVVSATE